MLQVDELFNIGPFECKVRQNSQNPCWYWIGWDGESYLMYLRLVGSEDDNLSHYTRFNLKTLDPTIIYKELVALDGPDFKDLDNLTKYVELLRTHLISKQIKILK
jgi:hypothetical protein